MSLKVLANESIFFRRSAMSRQGYGHVNIVVWPRTYRRGSDLFEQVLCAVWTQLSWPTAGAASLLEGLYYLHCRNPFVHKLISGHIPLTETYPLSHFKVPTPWATYPISSR
jgi:hypothetical protein